MEVVFWQMASLAESFKAGGCVQPDEKGQQTTLLNIYICFKNEYLLFMLIHI